MTEAVDEMVRSEMEKYRYSIDDLNKLYSNLRTIASDADDSLVVSIPFSMKKTGLTIPSRHQDSFPEWS